MDLSVASDQTSKNSVEKTPNFLEVTYSYKRLPKSNCPSIFAAYLLDHFFKKPGNLLDVGCDRGEYVTEFAKLGFRTTGLDNAPSSKNFAPGGDIRFHELMLLGVGVK